MVRPLLALAVAATALAAAGSVHAATGDFLVADDSAFSDDKGGVIRVNPANGDQTVLSSNVVPGGFAPFDHGPFGIAAAANGDIFVLDYNAGGGTGAVIRIDPASGAQTVVSDNDIAGAVGPALFNDPLNIAIGPDGDLFVTDDGTASIIRVDPATGAHALVTSGVNLEGPEGIAIAANGDMFVTDYDSPPGPGDNTGALIKVTPGGQQTVISDNAISEAVATNSGRFADPVGLEIRSNGHLLVVDQNAEVGTGAVLDVDPVNGRQTVVSENATAGGTGKFVGPIQPRTAPNGDLLVVDTSSQPGTSPTQGAILRVNPNGTHSVVSSGDLFQDPLDIAIEGTPAPRGPQGGTQAGTAGSAGSALIDSVAPALAGGVLASPEVWAVDRSGRREVPVASRARKGTTFRFLLSEPARVVFTIERRARGRRVGRRCRKQTRKNRKRRRCNRFVRAGRFAAAGALGVNGKRFSGRIGRRTLRPGRYRAVVVASDAAGNRSKAQRVGFRVVRR